MVHIKVPPTRRMNEYIEKKMEILVYTMMMDLWAYLLLSAIFTIFIYKLLTRSNKTNLPPGPSGLPIIGNLHQLSNLPHRDLRELAKKHGPVMHLNLGSVPTLVVSSSETARQILVTHDLDCCSRPSLKVPGKFSYDNLGLGSAPYGDYWKEMRKIYVVELLSSRRVQSFKYIRKEEVDSLIDSISQSAINGSSVNLSDKLLKTTVTVSWRSGLGTSFNESSERFLRIIDEVKAVLGSFSASNFFPVFGPIFDRLMGLDRRVEKSFKKLDTFFDKVIDDHARKGETKDGKEDLVDVMLKMERDHVQFGTSPLSRDHIKAVLMEVLLGGGSPTATMSVWVMTELVRHPRVMKKVQHEIRSIIGDKGSLTEDDIDKFKYLKMAIKETYRLHIPGPLLFPRESINKFQLHGYDVYPKTWIQVNAWAICRDPEMWKDPDDFIPERFTDGLIDIKANTFDVLPFGGGRRGCPGQNMATTMLESITANLLYHFDWKLPNGMKEGDLSIEEMPGIAIQKKVPLELVPIKHHH